MVADEFSAVANKVVTATKALVIADQDPIPRVTLSAPAVVHDYPSFPERRGVPTPPSVALVPLVAEEVWPGAVCRVYASPDALRHPPQPRRHPPAAVVVADDGRGADGRPLEVVRVKDVPGGRGEQDVYQLPCKTELAAYPFLHRKRRGLLTG